MLITSLERELYQEFEEFFSEGGKNIRIKLSLLPEVLMSINHTGTNALLHTGAQVTSCGKVHKLLWSNLCRLKPPKPWYLHLIHLWRYTSSVTTIGSDLILQEHAHITSFLRPTEPGLQVLPGQYVQPQTYHLSWEAGRETSLNHSHALPVARSRGSVTERMMHPRDSRGRGRIAQTAEAVVPATAPWHYTST